MNEDRDTENWRTTTDHSEIEQWADDHGMVPVQRSGEGGERVLDVDKESDRMTDDRITWDEFFEQFESERLAFRYPPEGSVDRDEMVCNVVDRDSSGRETGPDRTRQGTATPTASDATEGGKAWQSTTDHARIEQWADEHDMVPVQEEGPGGELVIDVDEERRRTTDEQITWKRFFELFEADDLTFQYRSDDSGGVDADVVDRDEATNRLPEDDSDQEMVAMSDTGEGGTIVPEGPGGEADEDTEGRNDNAEGRHDNAEGRGDDVEGRGDDSAMSESAGGVERHALVLDEIYEDPGLVDSRVEEEYLVLKNDGESPLDLSGWTVSNDAGQSYVFAEGVVLDPGARLTLHSGEGSDTNEDQYWDAAEPIWDQKGGTVVVTTADGAEVLREPYKA